MSSKRKSPPTKLEGGASIHTSANIAPSSPNSSSANMLSPIMGPHYTPSHHHQLMTNNVHPAMVGGSSSVGLALDHHNQRTQRQHHLRQQHQLQQSPHNTQTHHQVPINCGRSGLGGLQQPPAATNNSNCSGDEASGTCQSPPSMTSDLGGTGSDADVDSYRSSTPVSDTGGGGSVDTAARPASRREISDCEEPCKKQRLTVDNLHLTTSPADLMSTASALFSVCFLFLCIYFPCYFMFFCCCCCKI